MNIPPKIRMTGRTKVDHIGVNQYGTLQRIGGFWLQGFGILQVLTGSAIN